MGGKCFSDESHGVVMFKSKFGLSAVPKVMHLAPQWRHSQVWPACIPKAMAPIVPALGCQMP